MNFEYLLLLITVFTFILAFFVSLFEISFHSFSRIALSRFLKNKENKINLLDKYEEIEFSLKALSRASQLIFFILFFIIFPKIKGWYIFLLFASLLLYIFIFELLPRFFNSLNREKTLNFFLPFVNPFRKVTSPFVIIVRLIKPKTKDIRSEGDLEEQFKIFIGEGEQEGLIEQEDRELIESVVEFGDTIVKEIMTPRVEMVCVRESSTIRELKDIILKVKHSRIPVYKEKIDNIVGIILAKDLLKFWGDEYLKSPIKPLIRPPFFVPESMQISQLLKEFQKIRQKLAIVVDEYGGVAGLVTMEDIVEEIVGEIRDEYDEVTEDIIREDENSFLVEGDTEIEDLEEKLQIELKNEDYNTISGLITQTLNRLPSKGETIDLKQFKIEILDVDEKRIKKVRIKKVPSETNKENG